MHVNVLIVGGGISGLTLAYKCIQLGYNVIIFEKSDRLGGRIHTIYDSNFNYEAGAGRLSNNHSKLISLINEFNLNLYPLNSKKEFRDNYCNNSPINDPSKSLLKHVIKFGKTLSHDKLRQITFHQLCNSILGINKTNKLINSYGYNAEFELMNAYDAIKLFDIDNSSKYFGIKEGFSELINRLKSAILKSGHAKIMMESEVIGFIQKSSYVQLKIKAKDKIHIYKGKILVCAVPRDSLINIYKWNPEQLSLINSIESVSLHRIYGKFNKNLALNNTTTNNPIRQFINVIPSEGIAMMSYSDSNYADYWNKYSIQGDKELRKAVLTHLHAVFPEIPKLPKPKWIQSYYWQYGVHMWKIGIDSLNTKQKIQQIFGPNIPFFIIGEAYSNNQAWIEGALETVDDILPKITEFIHNNKNGGSSDQWVKVKLNNQLIKVDTSQWRNQHPGGSMPFDVHNHKLVNEFMKMHSAHYIDGDPKKGFKKSVIDAINKFKLV